MTIVRPALCSLLLALALGACASNGRTDATDRRDDVEVETCYPERVHYCEPADTRSVHYYDERRPDVVVSRLTYREGGGLSYYIERELDTDRRFYYDDDAARRRGPSENHRGERLPDSDWATNATASASAGGPPPHRAASLHAVHSPSEISR